MMKNSLHLGSAATAILLGVTAGSFADGTETLGPPASIQVAQGSGFAEGGTGLFEQPATMTVTVPGGATVQQTLLYWEGQHNAPENGDNTIRVNGVDITGEAIGGPTRFFLASDGEHWTTTFRADISALGLVGPGGNALTVDGLENDFEPPRNNGAGVLVIYDDGTAADLMVRDGNDNAYRWFAPPLDTTAPQTFVFAAAEAGRTAGLSLFAGSVSDGRVRPNAIDITVNGNTTRLVNDMMSNDGFEWDSPTIPVDVPAGATELTVQLLSIDDNSGNQPASITWVTAALALPRPPAAPPEGVEGRMTGGGSVFTQSDMRVTHGFQLHCDASQVPNNLEINWGHGNRFHLEELQAATCTDDPTIAPDPPVAPFDTYDGRGTGRFNGTAGATAVWRFTDAGEPGVNDWAQIQITDANGEVVLVVAGYLNKGNHQAHASTGSARPAAIGVAAPARASVSQNYPNPFNPETQIEFDLPAGAPVRLAVYDLLGQEVRVLADGYHGGGRHRVLWDGRDGAGQAVSSGVYFYRLESGAVTESRRMSLLR